MVYVHIPHCKRTENASKAWKESRVRIFITAQNSLFHISISTLSLSHNLNGWERPHICGHMPVILLVYIVKLVLAIWPELCRDYSVWTLGRDRFDLWDWGLAHSVDRKLRFLTIYAFDAMLYTTKPTIKRKRASVDFVYLLLWVVKPWFYHCWLKFLLSTLCVCVCVWLRERKRALVHFLYIIVFSSEAMVSILVYLSMCCL